MDSNHVTVIYKWTAQPGKLEELASIYADVTDAMQANEPGAEAVHIYVSEQENALYVRDEFQDAAAMGFHLSTTAANHFPQLISIATPVRSSSSGTFPTSSCKRPSRCSSAASSQRTPPDSIAERGQLRATGEVVAERRHLPRTRPGTEPRVRATSSSAWVAACRSSPTSDRTTPRACPTRAGDGAEWTSSRASWRRTA